MSTLFIILIILVSVLLALIVLIQNPKGGGLSSGFSGGANLMGVQRTGDFLEKGTWTLVVVLMVFCLALNILGPSGSTATQQLNDQLEAPIQHTPGFAPMGEGAPATAPQEQPAVVGDSTN